MRASRLVKGIVSRAFVRVFVRILAELERVVRDVARAHRQNEDIEFIGDERVATRAAWTVGGLYVLQLREEVLDVPLEFL